jgi:hypothetical protein
MSQYSAPRNEKNSGREPVTLILTATVTPPTTMPGSVRNSSKLRRQEYEDAFRHYLAVDDSLINRIVLLENSDADLAPFHRIAQESGSSKSIAMVNCSSDYPAEMGKGYGEFLMLDRGLATLDAPHPKNRYWKVTGRLKVANIEQMIRLAPTHYDVYCDLREVPFIGDSLGGNRWMELRLFSFTFEAYERIFKGRYALNSVLEKALFAEVMRESKAGRLDLVPRFLSQPSFIGFSGYSNADYSGIGYRSKSALRRVSRAIAPWLWL